jgi:hypothetical protein
MELQNYDMERITSFLYGLLEFSTDALIYTKTTGYSDPPNPIGTWSLKGDILSITGTALPCKKYKIVYLGKGSLHLKEIWK